MSMYLVGGDLVRAFRGVLHRLFPVSPINHILVIDFELN